MGNAKKYDRQRQFSKEMFTIERKKSKIQTLEN
jgi:hypothetical protein